MDEPRISVIMPVHNGEPHLRKAIESILHQTFSSFEFIIVDDASTDSTQRIMEAYAARDQRIRTVRNDRNIGLTKSLNRAIEPVSTEYIARMDADDISLPERFQKQMDFMERHPEVGACGSSVRIMDTGEYWKYHEEHDDIVSNLIFNNTLAHPCVMMSTEVLRRNDLRYDEEFRYAQDYELWTRLGRRTKLANVDQPLVHLRKNPGESSTDKYSRQAASARLIRERLLSDLGIGTAPSDRNLHEIISTEDCPADRTFVSASSKWLLRLMTANRESRRYPEPAFCRALAKKWYRICSKSARNGLFAARMFYLNPLWRHSPLNMDGHVRFVARCLIARAGS